MENCNELFCNKSLHRLASCHHDLFGDASFHLHDVRQCNIISHIKNLQNTCKLFITVRVLGRISFHVMAEKWQHVKYALAYLSFHVCWYGNRLFLTSDMFLIISLVVDQLSVNVSLALWACEISTL